MVKYWTFSVFFHLFFRNFYMLSIFLKTVFLNHDHAFRFIWKSIVKIMYYNQFRFFFIIKMKVLLRKQCVECVYNPITLCPICTNKPRRILHIYSLYSKLFNPEFLNTKSHHNHWKHTGAIRFSNLRFISKMGRVKFFKEILAIRNYYSY